MDLLAPVQKRSADLVFLMGQRLLDFVTGKLSGRVVLGTLIPAIFICYFGTLLMAVFCFPESYDWRSSVISNLLSPEHNPKFHWLASIGLAFAGLFAVPFGGYIGQRLRPVSRLWANIGVGALISGFVLLILAAIIVTRRSHPLFGILGIHELLARTSAIGLGIGIVCFYGCLLRGTSSIGRNRRGRALVFLWSIITLSALIALTGSFCAVLLSKAGVLGLLPAGQLLKHSPLWHLAFWEWIGSGTVFLFLISAACLLPEMIAARDFAWPSTSRKIARFRASSPLSKTLEQPRPLYLFSTSSHVDAGADRIK
jgi:hypothetical protein